MNGKITAALIIHILVTLAGFTMNLIVGSVLGFFLLFNLIGITLLLSNKVRAGNTLFIVGSIGFVPIGLIGILGARSNLDKLNEQEFEHKRKLQHP